MSLINTNSTKYYYDVNGWKVGSEIRFIELWPCQTNASSNVDVTIAYGKVPEKLKGSRAEGIGFQVKNDHYILTIQRLCRFMVSHGQCITIDPMPGVEEDALRPFILGSVFGALTHQRELLPIHASAVQFGKSALLFAGASGVGKSTTAVSFLLKGHNIISDDVSVVHFNKNGEPIIHPGVARLKVCEDLVREIPHGTKLNKISKAHDKLFLPLECSSKPQVSLITHLFCLRKGKQKELCVKELQGIEKYRAVSTNVFRPKLIDGLGVRKANFTQVSDFVEKARVFEIMRPEEGKDKLKLFDNIEEFLY